MVKKKEIVILKRTCMDCGREIEVHINKKTKKILSGHWYYGSHKFGIGDWCSHRLDKDSKGKLIFVKIVPLHKEIYYTLKDYFRLLFKRYREEEFWVCKECTFAEYGKEVKRRSKNPSKRHDTYIRR